MDRKLIESFRETLRKAGYEELIVKPSTNQLSLAGRKGDIRVLVQFSNGMRKPSGFLLNDKIPIKSHVAAVPHLDAPQYTPHSFQGMGSTGHVGISPKSSQA